MINGSDNSADGVPSKGATVGGVGQAGKRMGGILVGTGKFQSKTFVAIGDGVPVGVGVGVSHNGRGVVVAVGVLVGVGEPVVVGVLVAVAVAVAVGF